MPRHVTCPSCHTMIDTGTGKSASKPTESARVTELLKDQVRLKMHLRKLQQSLSASEAENHLLRQELDQTPAGRKIVIDVGSIAKSLQKLQEDLSKGQKEAS